MKGGEHRTRRNAQVKHDTTPSLVVEVILMDLYGLFMDLRSKSQELVTTTVLKFNEFDVFGYMY